MAFKMKDYPMHKGTASHAGAYKKAASNSPMTKKNIDELLAQREKLRAIKAQRERDGKSTTVIDKRIKINQDKINANPTAQEWRKQGETSTEEPNIGVRQDPVRLERQDTPNGEGAFNK